MLLLLLVPVGVGLLGQVGPGPAVLGPAVLGVAVTGRGGVLRLGRRRRGGLLAVVVRRLLLLLSCW
ncbi:hypothetical protein ACWF0M_34870 [Kribbella sp. NPDC055110]